MTVASLLVKIGADISELEKNLSRAQRSIEDTGRRMTDMGKTLSARVTAPLAALGAVSVRAWGIQEKAENQLRAALQANGREVDGLFNRYKAFASQMQQVSTVGDEVTLQMLQQAESLGLTGDAAERAVKNSIAMQSAFGVNAQSAIRYTAALEQGNATMLTRYIPTLREIEDESERVAEAQRVLGNAFSTVGAEADSSIGSFQQAKNAIGDASEVIGRIVSEAIVPTAKRVKELAEAFQELDGQTQRQIVRWGVMAATMGPALIVIGKATVGISKLIGVVRALTTAQVALNTAQKANVFVALAAGVALLTERIWSANRAAKTLRDTVSEALDMDAQGTSAELAKVEEGIKAVEKEIENATSLYKSMDALNTDAAQKRLGELKAEREQLYLTHVEISKKIAATELAAEKQDQVADAVKDTARAYEDLKIAAEKPENEIIDTIAIAEARQLRQEYEEFSRALSDVLNITLDLGPALELPAESTDEVSRSFVGLEMTAGQVLDRLTFGAERLDSVLKSVARQLASRAIMTGLKMLTGTSTVSGIGGFLGSIIGINDGIVRSDGTVVRINPNDDVLAMKDFSSLGGGQRVVVEGAIRGDVIHLANARGGGRFR